ncbi:MAG: YrhK family protein [Thermodesulfobacteriota bacterium]
MPHIFTNRPRLHDLTADRKDLKKQFRWETINAIIYKLGGLVFIAGSILFFPALDAHRDLGCWIFFVGSVFYLVVTAHDLAEVRYNWKSMDAHDRWAKFEYSAALSYFWGTVLFTVGSIFFLSFVDLAIPGAWFFVLGSFLFVLGACINVLQIAKADTMLTLHLMNLTAVAFVVGSVLFTLASIPYLWDFESASDHLTLNKFMAWQYLIGSVLFFMGGVFNYWRAYVIIHRAISAEDKKV